MTEPIVVSYSELDTYRQCPLKHHVLYANRWTKPAPPDSALTKGTLYHRVMEAHYRVIKSYQDQTGLVDPGSEEEKALLAAAHEVVMLMLYDPTTGLQDENQELIQWMYEGHVAHYGSNADWRVMAVEHQVVTPLLDPHGRKSRYHLKAKMDLVIRQRHTGALWVVDHKSGANLPNQMDLELDDQFGLYQWAMTQVGHKVMGSIHMANRTQRLKTREMEPDERFRMTYLNRGDIELRNIALDAYGAAYNAHPPKSAKVQPYSSPDPRQCSWKCNLKEEHLLMRNGRNMDEVLTEYGWVIDKTRH